MMVICKEEVSDESHGFFRIRVGPRLYGNRTSPRTAASCFTRSWRSTTSRTTTTSAATAGTTGARGARTWSTCCRSCGARSPAPGEDARLSGPGHNYGDAPRPARRPSRKARGGRIPGVFNRRATPRGGMHRRSNAAVIMSGTTKASRAARTVRSWRRGARAPGSTGSPVLRASPRRLRDRSRRHAQPRQNPDLENHPHGEHREHRQRSFHIAHPTDRLYRHGHLAGDRHHAVASAALQWSFTCVKREHGRAALCGEQVPRHVKEHGAGETEGVDPVENASVS